MGRKLMPDGRRTVVGVRLSDDDCARLDAMRGDTARAELAYAIIKNAIGGITVLEPDPEIPPPKLARAVEAAASRKPAVPVVVDDRMPPGTAALVGPGYDGKPQEPVIITGLAADPPARETRRCNHPGRRVTGGWCPGCQWTVEPGGKFAERQR